MLKFDNYFLELIPYYCLQYTQKNLYNSYSLNHNLKNKSLSYSKSQHFINYLEQGKNYFTHSENSDISVKPILSYYGLVQLLKACITIVDPEYPENSSVLAHGITSRKRKKQNFDFLNDEVKIQKNGLFVHSCKKMFHVEHFYQEKFSMLSLIARIPELASFSKCTMEEAHLHKVKTTNGNLIIENNVITNLNISVDMFIKNYLTNHKITYNNNELVIENFNKDNLDLNNTKPFYYNISDENLYCINHRDIYNYIPELLVHYLILYNLSMLCRYETDWWIETLKDNTTLEYNYIRLYLNYCDSKISFLIKEFILYHFKDKH